MSMEFDFSEFTKMSAVLGDVADGAGTFIRKAVEVSARHVDDDWTKPLEGSATVPQGPKSITYDIKGGEAIRGSDISAEIGPELKGQGPIVGMLEYGTPSTGPRGFGAAALQQNEGDFVKGILLAAQDAERAAGL